MHLSIYDPAAREERTRRRRLGGYGAGYGDGDGTGTGGGYGTRPWRGLAARPQLRIEQR